MYRIMDGGVPLSFKLRRILEGEGAQCALCYQHMRFETWRSRCSSSACPRLARLAKARPGPPARRPGQNHDYDKRMAVGQNPLVEAPNPNAVSLSL